MPRFVILILRCLLVLALLPGPISAAGWPAGLGCVHAQAAEPAAQAAHHEPAARAEHPCCRDAGDPAGAPEDRCCPACDHCGPLVQPVSLITTLPFAPLPCAAERPSEPDSAPPSNTCSPLLRPPRA